MGSSSGSAPASQTPAQLAKAALRHLAEQRLEPTPENFRKAYESESGISAAAPETAPAPLAPTAVDAAHLSPSADGERWSQLIGRIVRGAERGGRQWTSARKKDSLKRVLEGSKNSANRLHQRLSQLVGGWDSDTLDDSLIEVSETEGAEAAANPTGTASGTPTPAASPASDGTVNAQAVAQHAIGDGRWPALAEHAVDHLQGALLTALPDHLAPAVETRAELQTALAQARQPGLPEAEPEAVHQQITQACDQARRIIEHRYHLIDQLNELCHTLTDSLVELAEDDSWVQGQCQAMRFQLDEGLNNRGVKHMQDLLEGTRERQKALKQERESARQALKQFIHDMLQEIAALGSTTEQFQQSLGRYAETIGQADSLESLAGVVRDMVEESRNVHGLVNQAQTRMQAEHQRATELTDRVRTLEDEIRRLSDEVSTDPLTQIANRRGLAKAFDTECARMQRSGGMLAIGLLDGDNFKKLNDQMGHHTGHLGLQFPPPRVGRSPGPDGSPGARGHAVRDEKRGRTGPGPLRLGPVRGQADGQEPNLRGLISPSNGARHRGSARAGHRRSDPGQRPARPRHAATPPPPRPAGHSFPAPAGR